MIFVCVFLCFVVTGGCDVSKDIPPKGYVSEELALEQAKTLAWDAFNYGFKAGSAGYSREKAVSQLESVIGTAPDKYK